LTTKRIPFEVDISRVIELLATQIYQSPLALLRENTQNAFDAVLMRRALGQDFTPEIRVTFEERTIRIQDNGIGMTAVELEENYWHAGASGKNTQQARDAGVVGTFGIGAMANFGIAQKLAVITESALDGTRTQSEVQRDQLSATKDCITIDAIDPSGEPGTIVDATLEADASLSIGEAVQYITQFTEFVDVAVYVNDDLVSMKPIASVLPSERHKWDKHRDGVDLAGIATANVKVYGLASGELRVLVEEIDTLPPTGPAGRAVLLQGTGALRTLRSGFGLATISVPSLYGFGGVIDLAALQPTAGREALEARSNDLLIRLMGSLDNVVSEMASSRSESFENQAFLQWVARSARYDLCGKLLVRVEPGNVERQLSVATEAVNSKFYDGGDTALISAYASEDAPLIVTSRRGPRRDCELGYLRAHEVPEVSDEPQVVEMIADKKASVAHGAVALRIARVLADDYFIETQVHFARLTHDIPLMLDRQSMPPQLLLDPDGSALAPLLELYKSDFDSFGPFVKDFVRAHVFPKLADLVPSSTREGADAFLRRLRGKRELFEIAWTDREDLESIWDKYAGGEISLAEAAKRSAAAPRRSVVEVGRDQATTLRSVLPILEDSDPSPDEAPGGSYGPLPPVDRRETETEALILTTEEAFNGYSCFLALSDRVVQQNAEFFFQPHATSVVWGGQKILFVFQHHSGRFGLYYDVQCPGLVADVSGGGPYRTSTILLKNRIFIPVPLEIAHNVTPDMEQLIRLEVRSDILYLETENQRQPA
jgi:molecular chaperone HtpG